MTRAGTGKTYASAFALREENPKKALFLVHREQIAKQAIASYKKVFGQTKVFGLLPGNSKDYEADYLFSTMQMMAKPETLARFRKDEFDTIIIDEAHRIGASSYQSIVEYFEPKFWLGMTASTERTDSYDVYEAFHHNIAYEIRLQQALEENLLCPFYYFGITDLQINGETIDEKTGLKDFNKLTSDDRVDYVIEQIEYYGYSGDRVKGLVFCSSKREAMLLSEKFNKRGYQTTALTGEDSQEKRELAIEKLVSDDINNKFDYIFTVDIFNEGVDIPEINQVVMLRPTESPIVFVQQLGRGLRKANEKEYVVILDFIGNYKNNFMIPIALSGDRSYNKDNIRRYVLEDKIRLSEVEEKIVEFISKKLASGKRIHELELLNRMLILKSGLMNGLRKTLDSEYGIRLQEKSIKNIVNVMTNEFPAGTGKKTYSDCVFIENEEETGDYKISHSFSQMLENKEFYDIIKELVEFGISRYKSNYSRRYQDTNLVLYQKYTYEDVCRLLDWENNEVPLNIGGYKYDKNTKTFPVFINYDKAENIQDTIKYEDHFISSNQLIAISKQSRTMESEDVQNFLFAEQRGIKVELFVRKNKDDKISKEFYYLGRMKATGQAKEFVMANTDKTAVEIEWVLDTPVREDIYEYIVNG